MDDADRIQLGDARAPRPWTAGDAVAVATYDGRAVGHALRFARSLGVRVRAARPRAAISRAIFLRELSVYFHADFLACH
ncbi:hypothetical protein GUJ93_ZPchr0010g8028 [Zizania palustris]|uniref:Uncharacterized protein n=1 Tax=Zizania palustris TaxID=103762 RepID=A0A8J5WAF9_ZIZPA|nr:hypothetical protein GUJ93_ZPchr0010g8028 [Zizania palustris]